MKTRVPDIYIIGAQKSGTTTLYDWLAQHPEIYAHPLAKDYPFFSNDRTYNDGPKQFLSFPKGAQECQLVLGGEANAMFATNGPSRMNSLIPSAQLIAIVRNPVDRAFSAYCYAIERLLENRSPQTAFDDEMRGYRYSNEDSLQRDYLQHGLYSQQLNRVYRYFKKEQVKVVIFEELISDPKNVLCEIFNFIGVEDNYVPKLDAKNQTEGGSRLPWLSKIILRSPSSHLTRKIGKMVIPYSMRTGIRRSLVALNRIKRKKPEFTHELKQELNNYYQQEIVELEKILGREIGIWKKSLLPKKLSP